MAILFPFPPDWGTSYKVTNTFQTEIIEARDYTEQRRALRFYPRRSIAFSPSEHGSDARYLRQLLTQWQQSEFVFPEMTRFGTLSVAATAGDTAVTISPVPSWLIGAKTLVLGDPLTGEVISVDSVTGGYVALSAALVNNYAIGARIYLGLKGRIDQSLNRKALTNTAGQVDISFNADPGTFSEDGGTAATIFNTRELLLTRPNWATQPTITHAGLLEDVDFGYGSVEHYQPTSWNRSTLQATYLARSADEADDMIQFFLRQKGQRGEFYCPTWEEDFDISIGAGATASYLDVPGTQFASLFSDRTIYGALVIFYKDGTYAARTVSGLTVVSGNSRVALGSALSQAVNSGTTKQVCWLPVVRFAVDSLVMEWVTNEVAQWQISMVTVKAATS
jgi:hypothetical protein